LTRSTWPVIPAGAVRGAEGDDVGDLLDGAEPVEVGVGELHQLLGRGDGGVRDQDVPAASG